jgi:hypothetical protein
MALAANEPRLSARSTSAPGTCLNVTRKSTASRIWEMDIQVKTNQQQSCIRAGERRTLHAERRMPNAKPTSSAVGQNF